MSATKSREVIWGGRIAEHRRSMPRRQRIDVMRTNSLAGHQIRLIRLL